MASSKKNDTSFYDLTLLAPGTITVEGEITHVSDRTVMVNRQRSGSSKRQIESIPRSAIIFVKGGALAEGELATITFRDDKAPVGRKMTKIRIEGTDKASGLIRGSNEAGDTVLIDPEYAKLITSKDTEVDVPTSVEKKKKDSAKKKSKSSSKDK